MDKLRLRSALAASLQDQLDRSADPVATLMELRRDLQGWATRIAPDVEHTEILDLLRDVAEQELLRRRPPAG